VNKKMLNFVPYVRGGYKVIGIFSLVVCLVCFLPKSGVLAQSLSFDDQVAEILKNHPRIEAAKQTIKSLQEGLRVSQKSWFPGFHVALRT